MNYIEENNIKKNIFLEKKPFAFGSKGKIFQIINDENKVGKIYNFRNEAQKLELERKLEFMIKNCPTNNSNQKTKDAIVWPEKLIYNQNESFVGYTMPFIKDSKPLEYLILKQPQNKLGEKWRKFDILNGNLIRKKILFDITKTVDELHKTNNYVLLDLKPDNILINSDGQISIIGLDSIQITEKNSIIFKGDSYTPDYAPAEKKAFLGRVIHKNWDYFSFGVIAYKILLFVHPFSSSHSIYDNIEDCIENGQFVNGKNKSNFNVISPPHSKFDLLEYELKNLFIKCFDEGYSNPSKRPDFKEWANALLPTIKKKENATSKQKSVVAPLEIQTKDDIIILYSWDNEFHKQKVLEFACHLREEEGFPVTLDRWLSEEETAIDFIKMMHLAIEGFKKIIIVLSKGYKVKADSFEGGAGTEYGLIIKDIQTKPKKYILVSFEGISNDITPLSFRGRDTIDLSDDKDGEWNKLRSKLRDEPIIEKPPLAKTQKPVMKTKIGKFRSNNK